MNPVVTLSTLALAWAFILCVLFRPEDMSGNLDHKHVLVCRHAPLLSGRLPRGQDVLTFSLTMASHCYGQTLARIDSQTRLMCV